MSHKKKTIAAIETKNGPKFLTWSKTVLSKIKLSKSSRAGVIVDKSGIPQLFVFDTPAFLDILSAIDETLVDRLSDEEYHSKLGNPAGYFIDAIEAQLPPDPKYLQSLRKAIDEANRTGWIPFPNILKNLQLK